MSSSLLESVKFLTYSVPKHQAVVVWNFMVREWQVVLGSQVIYRCNTLEGWRATAYAKAINERLANPSKVQAWG